MNTTPTRFTFNLTVTRVLTGGAATRKFTLTFPTREDAGHAAELYAQGGCSTQVSPTVWPDEIEFSGFAENNSGFERRLGRVSVKGLTDENYNANRVFYVKGERWVLQTRFGCDCMTGASFYSCMQSDWCPRSSESVSHILR